MVFSYLKKVILASITAVSLVLFGIVPAANARWGDLSSPINISFLGQEGDYQRISWMPPNINKTGEPISGYKIFYKNMWDQNNDKGEIIVDGDRLETLIPMKPSMWYSVEIVAMTLKEGLGYRSTSYSLFTSPPAKENGISPIVTSSLPLNTSLVDKDKVKITWEQPYMDKAKDIDLKEYRIEINHVVVATVPFPHSQAVVTIPNYKENTLYTVGVYSYRIIAGKLNLAASSYPSKYTTPMDSYYSCDDIEIMTARGSGEPYWNEEDGTIIKGTEEQTLLTNEQIADELPGYTGSVNGSTETIFAETLENTIAGTSNYSVNSYAVPYPAVKPVFGDWGNWSADQFWTMNVAFGQSVNVGTEMVVDRVAQIRNLCPDTKIALSGYSQGALVMGNAIDALAKQDTHVDSVTLFGDPFFNPNDTSADRSNFSTTHAGMLANRDKWSLTTNAKVESYCHDLDIFCNLTETTTNLWDTGVPEASLVLYGSFTVPHETYPIEWEADANHNSAKFGAWGAAEVLTGIRVSEE